MSNAKQIKHQEQEQLQLPQVSKDVKILFKMPRESTKHRGFQYLFF